MMLSGKDWYLLTVDNGTSLRYFGVECVHVGVLAEYMKGATTIQPIQNACRYLSKYKLGGRRDIKHI